MQEPAPGTPGTQSFDYLEPRVDYKVFDLAPRLGRVPEYDLGLTETQRQRVTRLLTEYTAISLHEHPKILPADVTRLRDYNRTGRDSFGFDGLARPGMTAVFDNFMSGTGCVTSEHAWKWDDVIYDIGLRFADVAEQDYVVVATTLAEIHAAKRDGRLALVAGPEAATMIENELDRIDILGIAIDVSHSGDQTSLDVIEASRVPGVHHARESVMDHFVHCVDLVGIDHVTFGPDTVFGDHVGLRSVYAGNYAQDSGCRPEHPRVPYVSGVENPAGWGVGGVLRSGSAWSTTRRTRAGRSSGRRG